ncbi:MULTISPECIES: folylpolyglutamate synthase/dihydrofolate synthase family protein [unclassified Kaistella]|uniref:bifunctional folylpolyglutamate synthase/dihydrofolate synthase n=1 Tax=unclassified Kaistella TaxID=2762626 RepID=UPI002733C671|nr:MULTISPECIES: folylpolyglutamate synthase/dihydrofolate synthase family protein [unclassified Kaistella]MDP2455031.1 bifunctional folylpolyglutamate synthase/dihydrofolate synthase [Kaistella sp. SH11-4b]MDP2455986.1 bifunctional folylpolyglutamate synthase/dihydrofolate synthase [Kaistella sp. SH40-3]MDP2460701.1 bifunctional folylpolyglutamate synthase/dihydrofolate synthase [Kaistella sp. SH19-2b]
MTNQQYQEAIDWLFVQIPSYQTDGKKAYKPGLENIIKLCKLFGNPQEKLKIIHIGGTNGKGSTSNMLSSVLQEAGYKTGLYNSPHLIDFTERIKINGENCDKEFVYHFIQKLRNLPKEITPSFFEFTTIMAFEYFFQKKVDYAIIEVGLGGRLDSTNIITPLISAITNVALDHQDLLGNTIEEITREKAGIIKPSIPIISGTEDALVLKIIKEKATEQNSEFIDATLIETNIKSDLKGNYQQKNIKVVLAIIKELQNLGIEISERDIEAGLLQVHKSTNFIGRWFEFSQDPLIICDTAHNQAGLELVFAQLNSIKRVKHIVLGFVAEKNIDEVLQILPTNSTFYFAKPSNNRGRQPKDYEELLKKSKINYKIFDTIQEAYLFAKQQLKKEEMIFIGGSNFVVGEFLEKNLRH